MLHDSQTAHLTTVDFAVRDIKIHKETGVPCDVTSQPDYTIWLTAYKRYITVSDIRLFKVKKYI